MGEVESAHARARPHSEGLGDHNSRIRLHIEQTPDRAFLRVVRTCRVARCRSDPTILFLDQVLAAQVFFTTVTPLLANPLMQAFGKGFRQAVGDGLGHDRVIVVILSPDRSQSSFRPIPLVTAKAPI
jgi:hypothetical protein